MMPNGRFAQIDYDDMGNVEFRFKNVDHNVH